MSNPLDYEEVMDDILDSPYLDDSTYGTEWQFSDEMEELNKALAAGILGEEWKSLEMVPTGEIGSDGGEGFNLSSPTGHSGGSMEVKKEFVYDPKGCWAQANPYTMAFVYPRDGAPYIVKGGMKDVEPFLKNTEKSPAIIHYTFWHYTIARRVIETINCGKVSIARKGSAKHGVWEISIADKGVSPYIIIAGMRKLPRKWIKELDEYIQVKAEESKGFRRIIL
jgi:hypothetical protein